MVDLSAVYADTDEAEARALAEMANKYWCACAYILPCHSQLFRGPLTGEPEI